MAEIRTWTLTDEQVEATAAKLAKVNARAAKKGLTGRYTWACGETMKVPVYDTTGVACTVDNVPCRMEQGRPVPCPILGYVIKTEFTVCGEAPSFGDWTFRATLTYDNGVLITRTAPGFDGIVDRTQVREGECDHCKTRRHRTDTYLLANTVTGELAQVGSSCIKDFLGHGFSPALLREVDGADLDQMEAGFGESGWLKFDVVSTLAVALAAIQTYGFVRASADKGTPTKYVVGDYLNGSSKAAAQYRAEIGPLVESKLAEAADLVEWVNGQDATSEYMVNLQALVSLDMVSERALGLLVSAPAAYTRATTERAEREARPESQYVGEVGSKVAFEATVKVVRYIEGYYGTTTLLLMLAPDGNMFKWFASGSKGFDEGAEVTVAGTIKGHEEYNGLKSTVLTRCKVVVKEAADPA